LPGRQTDRTGGLIVAEQATERMVVSATPARCFEVSSDIEAYPQWASDIKEVTIESRDEEGRPELVTFRAAAFGRSTNYTLAYDYSEAPGVLSWVQTRGDITSKLDGRYVFAASSDGRTEVTYHLEVEMKVPLPGFIKMRAQSRIMSIALRELKARVESEA
jgi:ribosome-associated toxin RatA of RatAB toxin-antitoxin module